MRTSHHTLLPIAILLFIALAVMPATAFYNPNTGRWLNRDPIEEEDGPNVSLCAHNNLINRIDPFGLWTTGVHHKIIDDWLVDPIWDRYPWRCCERIPVRRLLKEGSDQIDGVGNHSGDFFAAQATQNAHQHAMRSPGDDVSVAEAKYRQFIQNTLNEARRLSDRARQLTCTYAPESLVYSAVTKIGNAFHAISDNMSPAHSGFQLWSGSWEPTTVTDHVRQENMTAYPTYKLQLVSTVDGELLSYLNYVLAIQVR